MRTRPPALGCFRELMDQARIEREELWQELLRQGWQPRIAGPEDDCAEVVDLAIARTARREDIVGRQTVRKKQ